MRNVYQSLLLVIARATHQELARQIKYLKVENQILHSKPPARITEPRRNVIAWSGLRRSSARRSIS